MPMTLYHQSDPSSARTNEELSFLHAVEFSDVMSVRRLIRENPTLNVDVIDALGRTALRLAVRNENKELVELLLDLCNCENIQQAVLQAISENHSSVAELILRHPSYMQICRKRKRLGDTDGFFKTEVESQFSTDMTPLNLAAQKNNFEIVKLLLQRGDTIQKPDRFDCSCMECRNRMKFDQLRVANFRLNAYRGLASEAYVSLSSDDPFLAAFQLAKELRKLADVEEHFKKEYSDLAKQLSEYVVKLLDRVWTQQELEVVLNKKGAANTDKYEYLARLKLALQNREKKFVAHPSVQQYLVKIWHRSLHWTDTLSPFIRFLCLAALCVLYPFFVIADLVKPEWKWSRFARQPMVKFMGHVMSLIIFLLLLIISSSESMGRVSNTITLQSQYAGIATEYQAYRERLGPAAVPYGEDFPLRPHSLTVTEYLLFIWVMGMVIQETQKISSSGMTAHFKDLYNVTDFFLLVAYISNLVLLHWTLHRSQEAIAHLQDKNVTMMLHSRRETDLRLYWLNTDRRHWSQLDPTNIAEGLFALANIVSFSRIFYLLPANETLGPMQISLRRMINDIIKFMLFATIAIAGFMVSLRNVFWWYCEMQNISPGWRSDAPLRNGTNAATAFHNIRSQFITVFWWIYGRGPMDDALHLPAEYKHSQVTEGVGHFLAALYHVTIIIVLVNLLIAMMARSFEKIVGDVDAEWKYARSLLYMEYISDKCAAPVPLNILQHLRDVIVAFVTFLRHRSKDDLDPLPSTFVGNRRRHACYDDASLSDIAETGFSGALRSGKGVAPAGHRGLTPTASEKKPTYKEIVQTIVQRYIFDIQREKEEINMGNLDEARQKIKQTKWKLLELLDKRKAQTRHISICLQAVSSEVSTIVRLSPSRLRRPRTELWNPSAES